MEIKEISEKSGISIETLNHTKEIYGDLPSYLHCQGNCPSPYYEAYGYLWRNMVYRYSLELIEFQL